MLVYLPRLSQDDLHHRVNCDPGLEPKRFTVFVEELSSLRREVTNPDPCAKPGMVTFVERFRSPLNEHLGA